MAARCSHLEAICIRAIRVIRGLKKNSFRNIDDLIYRFVNISFSFGASGQLNPTSVSSAHVSRDLRTRVPRSPHTCPEISAHVSRDLGTRVQTELFQEPHVFSAFPRENLRILAAYFAAARYARAIVKFRAGVPLLKI